MGIKQGLSRSLLVRVLILSSALTTAFTIANFFNDYRRTKATLLSSISQIEESSIGPISSALFELDDALMKNHLEGLLNIPEIYSAEIVSEDGKILASQTKALSHKNDQFPSSVLKYFNLSGRNQTIKFKLSYDQAGEEKNLGYIAISFTEDFVINETIVRACYFFLSQGIKTILVSFFLFLIFQSYLTAHLVRIASFLKEGDAKETLYLLRKHKEDELTFLVDQINSMRKKLYERQEDLEESLQDHKSRSLIAAKLASVGEVAGNIAHEINNPLAIIDGRFRVLESKILTLREHINPDDYKLLESNIVAVNQTIIRISNVIKSMLTYARSNKKDPLARVKIKAMIDQLFSLTESRLAQKNIKFHSTLSNDELAISCREGEILQVLLNLVNNSYDAIADLEDPKMITIDCDSDGSFVFIKVTDTGKPIDPAILQEIFKPFYTTKKAGKGTGLGLSISFQLAKEHGGDLYLDSKSPQTCFVLKLPCIF